MSLDFVKDFIAGGTSGCIAKCCTAPIERVKLIIQTQDANPKIMSGEVPRYTGIGNCFSRVYEEQGPAAGWKRCDTRRYTHFPCPLFACAHSLCPLLSPDELFLHAYPMRS